MIPDPFFISFKLMEDQSMLIRTVRLFTNVLRNVLLLTHAFICIYISFGVCHVKFPNDSHFDLT